ncbi:MAG: S-methyl-5-thioribose-1-phosphate isomerase [Planctomycetia bacterium]
MDPAPASPLAPLAWQGSWHDGHLELLDQTLLPAREQRLRRSTVAEVVHDIQRLCVRGAPLLGLAGAYGLVLAQREALDPRPAATGTQALFTRLAADLERARPTAVNLPRAVRAACAATQHLAHDGAARAAALLAWAQALEAREREACAAIARHGVEALGPARRILTHCNAGALVTPGLGTALAPLYLLHARGERVEALADETRPLLQGLRLTAWELARAGIPCTVLAEGAAPGLMRQGRIEAAIVGADRICRNGDVVNKVGTYGVALACRAHGLPFLVAAPGSTFDAGTPEGRAVVIEERPGDGERYLLPGTRPAGVATCEPAFDVTPAALVTAYVTELGWHRPGTLPSRLFEGA